jgi:hypothetical protein
MSQIPKKKDQIVISKQNKHGVWTPAWKHGKFLTPDERQLPEVQEQIRTNPKFPVTWVLSDDGLMYTPGRWGVRLTAEQRVTGGLPTIQVYTQCNREWMWRTTKSDGTFTEVPVSLAERKKHGVPEATPFWNGVVSQ